MTGTSQAVWAHFSDQYALGGAKANTVAEQARQPGASDASGISANDFLTLLVTEMKNQDPTASADPNAYINQLVQVNSLQQLISINETLRADADTAAKAHTVNGPGVTAASETTQTHQFASQAVKPTTVQTSPSGVIGSAASTGNLSIPAANAAAERVAEALDARAKTQ